MQNKGIVNIPKDLQSRSKQELISIIKQLQKNDNQVSSDYQTSNANDGLDDKFASSIQKIQEKKGSSRPQKAKHAKKKQKLLSEFEFQRVALKLC